MLHYCPVVYLPPTTSARQLRQSRPFLFLTIMACTVRSMKQAHEIGDKIRHTLAQRFVIGLDRSIDLLQGLMVFLQWPFSHRKDQPFLFMCTNTSISLAQDLGFLSLKGETPLSYIKRFFPPKPGCKQAQRLQAQEFTTEDRRTTLALFMWTSMLVVFFPMRALSWTDTHNPRISSTIRRDTTLRWTPFMEESLRILIERPEWEGDMILTTQIRCNLLHQQITDVAIQQALLDQETRIPVLLQQSLAAQLADIWRTLPPSVSQHSMFLPAISYALNHSGTSSTPVPMSQHPLTTSPL